MRKVLSTRCRREETAGRSCRKKQQEVVGRNRMEKPQEETAGRDRRKWWEETVWRNSRKKLQEEITGKKRQKKPQSSYRK